MKTLLEVEGKMGPVPQPASSQYSSPLPDTNPNVRKDNATEKRKGAAPTKRFRPNTVSKPSEAATHPPTTVPKTPTNIKPQAQEGTSDNRPPPLEDALVCESTPQPDAGKISGNILRKEKIGYFLPIT